MGAHKMCFGGNTMKTVIDKLKEIKDMPKIISEIKNNYDMGLLTLPEYMGQTGKVYCDYAGKVHSLEQDHDISSSALSIMLEHINF